MKKRTLCIYVIAASLLAVLTTSCSDSRISAVQGNETEKILSGRRQSEAMQQSQTADPKEVSDAFFKMVEEVQKMNRETIDSLSNEDILELGKPILDASRNSVKLGNETLQKLNKALEGFAESILTITREDHAKISHDVEQIMINDRSRTTRNLNAEDVRGILLKINGGASAMSSSCEDLYNHDPYMGYIHLYPGDYLNIANDICPAGSIFYVHNGTYNQAWVGGSKDGNYWLGVGGVPILDGQGSVSRAFSGGMKLNTIAYLEIRNYTSHGIYSVSPASTNIQIKDMIFRNIGGNKSGAADFGAIHFDNTKNVLIRNSYFKNVSHSVRFRFSTGPLRVLNNEALNTGFNFFQCNECIGSNIKINNNSLEHSSQYGTDKLEDFINIFKSKGLNTDYIQVNNNRARVHLVNGNASGVSVFGSFIVLGDDGGENQEARDNIGVNTGNVGIGAAGGVNINVIDNVMYSEAVKDLSNTAFYSFRVLGSEPCNTHFFSGNVAHWYCYRNDCGAGPTNPILNRAHAPISKSDSDYCGLIKSEIRDSSRVFEDTSINEGIWNTW